MRNHRSVRVRAVALVLSCLLFCEAIFLPAGLYASGGDAQPEFTDFEPAGGGHTVNPFTGDFTWAVPVMDIPGAHGGGYSLSLSYHSGITPEDAASWVGYGWSLNPGSISRSLRGFPDDMNGADVRYWNRSRRNWTVGLSGNFGLEAFSADLPFQGNSTLRYNNDRGFSWSNGLGLEFMDGVGTLDYNLSNGESSFGLSINVGAVMSRDMKRMKWLTGERPVLRSALLRSRERYLSKAKLGVLSADNYAFVTHGSVSTPMPGPLYRGETWNVSPALLMAPSFLQLGPDARLTGTYSSQVNTGNGGVPGAPLDLQGYGYMYSGNAGADDMMDYYVEKDNSYERTDRILGIPFSNADQFILNGEGISGGFRAWQNRPGHYHPNVQTSVTTIHNVGFEGEAGGNVGIGATVGEGAQTLEVRDWQHKGNTTQYAFAPENAGEDEQTFFRFNHEPVGGLGFTSNDNLIQGTLSVLSPVPGNKTAEVNLPATTFQKVNNGNRAQRTSHVAWHTNTEMTLTDVGGKKYKSYTRDPLALQHVKRDGASNPIASGIGEFAVTQPDGVRYEYGLPVFSRNEYTLSYDIPENADIRDGFIAYRDLSNDALVRRKTGEERSEPYASGFLLTGIYAPDFIDRTGNGPTPDDHGGYTRFTYHQAAGTPGTAMKNTGSWFRWRTPYTGLQYDRGSLSDPADDNGSVRGGEREMYYLATIETRTHIAYFITGSTNLTVNGFVLQGSGEQRLDGMEAADNSSAAASATAKGTKRQEKLERIELFAKNANGLPAERIQTVFFEYDYSLCTGIPDHLNYNPSNPAASGTGKLTLKRMWMEYGDVRQTLISPYTFEYVYPQCVSAAQPGYLPVAYPAPYQAQFGNYGYGASQNPVYDPMNVDAWGHYQYDGASRHALYQSWMNQAADDAAFDVAAWHLKSIRLPSGGQLHVQYEPNTYSFVQDRPAMAMVSLASSPLPDRFYLNTADLGTLTAPEKNRLVSMMQEKFVNQGEKIFFKFYYKLVGTPADPVTTGSCNGDFITGYAQVAEAGQDASGIYVRMKTTPGALEELPRRVCKDFVQTQRAGKTVLTGECDPDDGVDGNGDPVDAVIGFAGYLAQMATSFPGSGGSVLTCMDLSLPDSYLRVPLPKPKKGGGVRVKRILMYDAGMEPGDQSLYGTEYVYEETDAASGIRSSYGVATNEPGTIREENALVGFMKRFRQNLLDRAVAGRDKETTEGPAGESILPAPSIGYSRVIEKSIHSGITSPGFTAFEFFTCRDFPFDMKLDHVTDGSQCASDFTGIRAEKDWLNVPAGLVNIHVNNLWLTQGFRFVQNDMHGKPKSTATYGGSYDTPSEWMLSALEQLEYYRPGEPVPVFHDIHAGPSPEWPGREAELVMERKVISDVYDNTNLETDGDLGLLPVPVPFVSLFPYFSKSTRQLSMHLTTQVISYPAIVKSVTRTTDGIQTVTRTEAMSEWNGGTQVTSSPDEYDGLNLQQSPSHNGTMRSISLDAAEYYPELRSKSINDRMKIRSGGTDQLTKTVVSGHLFLSVPASPSAALVQQLQKLTPGDLVALYHSSSSAPEGIYHVKEKYESGKPFELLPTTVYQYGAGAVGTALDLEVLRSGYTNELNTGAGQVTTYGEMLPAQPGTHTMSGVIHADAVLLSDSWPYDTMLYGGWPQTLPPGVTNPYETGEKGKWRTLSPFNYRTTVLPGNDESLTVPGYAGTNGRAYNGAGTLTDFTLFNWQTPAANDTSKWVRSSEVLTCNPHGSPLHERNRMGVYACVKMGYNHTLPYLTAANAPYHGVQFESFENVYTKGSTSFLEDGLVLQPGPLRTNTVAHTGDYSLQLLTGANRFGLKEMKDIAGKKCVFRVWVKEDYASGGSYTAPGNTHPELRITFDAGSGLSPIGFKKVAQTGEWSLYEAVMTALSAAPGGVFYPDIHFNTSVAGRKIWIDDAAVQPLEAQVSCTVYDPVTLRTLAVLNSNHFATLYFYDAEGKLSRKVIETEEGRKTVQDSYENTPTVTR